MSKNPEPSRLVTTATLIVKLQAQRTKAESRLTTIMAEARKLRAEITSCDKCQALAQLDLEVLAEQR